MNIVLSSEKQFYKREIESMGEGLALFKIKSIRSEHGYPKCHFMFQNGRKPPLDIAIDRHNNFIDYISWFIQDEHFLHDGDVPNVMWHSKSIQIFDKAFCEKMHYIEQEREFNLIKKENDIWLLSHESGNNLLGYNLGENTYILLDHEKEFAGIWWGNLVDEEIASLQKSKVL